MFGLMGLGMMQAEMMVGAEMGMAMGAGMGMGMRGMGYCAPGCMNTCCRRVIVCPPGCRSACCYSTTVCAPGCTLPCCTTQVVTRNYYAPPPPGTLNRDPYAPNSLFSNLQPMNYGQNDTDRQLLMQQQAKINLEKRRQEEAAEKLRLEKEQMLLMQEEQQLRQQKLKQEMEQKKLAEQRTQLYLNQQRIEQQRIEQQRIEQQKRDMMATQPLEPAKDYGRVPGEMGYPNKQNQQQVLYQGELFQKYGADWRQISGAMLTSQTFLDLQIQQITKIKIKGQSQLNGTRMIKISTQTGDYFFSAYDNQQLQWGLKLIWAKMALMGKICNINQPFNGHVEGEIVKKGFFSGWQPKYANVSGDGLRISKQMGGTVHTFIDSIPQIWTRFELISGSLLIIKMHHTGAKVQIGVPIENAMTWLRGICMLIRA